MPLVFRFKYVFYTNNAVKYFLNYIQLHLQKQGPTGPQKHSYLIEAPPPLKTREYDMNHQKCQNPKERLNRSTNNGDMAKIAKRPERD